MMMSMMVSIKQLICKGTMIFFATLIIVFIISTALIKPIVEDAYNKGYKRGINETCNSVWEFKNKINENWDINSPFGNSTPILNMSVCLLHKSTCNYS